MAESLQNSVRPTGGKEPVFSASDMRIDSLADEFELALRRGHSPRIEDFLSQVGEDIHAVALRELLKVEIELRRDRGELVDMEQYVRRFSGSEAVVRDAFLVSNVALATVAHPPSASLGSGDTVSFAREDSVAIPGQLQVRCPSCHAPVNLEADTQLTDVTCTGCGSQFSLVSEQDTSQLAPSLATMGRFELVSRLGMGAFGTVWKARDKELDRTVAIKIPRHGGLTAEDQEKFFREARAAAQLRHPNIVSVHEVGRDGDSVYIVSDFVRGVTLGDWLTGQKVTSREAAELCAKIAEALHHAHEQGVVHRDLKPANIMIDAAGQPHLMDFGLARREIGEVTITLEGHILGTPAYMSPEQAQGESHTADRRSDVYSLGVILFQLLTGELPFRGNPRMLLHQVISDEPPSPRKLNANVSKDLETITLKCLEKLPARRYQTANDVAAELKRYAIGEPILARPVSRAERAVRWARRNKTVSALSAAVALALVTGTLVSTYFAIDAQRQANVAIASANEAKAKETETKAVLDFVQDKIFAAARPEGEEGGLGHDVSLREAMKAALPFVETSFTKQPLIESRLRQTMGISFHNLGDARTAAEQYEKALAIAKRERGPDDPHTLANMYNLALTQGDLGKHEEAVKLHEETLARRKVKLGLYHYDTLWSHDSLAGEYQELGRDADALKLYEETLALRTEKLGAEHKDTLASMNNLAGCYYKLGRLEEAEKLYERSVALMQKIFGAEHSATLSTQGNLAAVYKSLDRHAESIKLTEDTLALQKAKLGADHPHTLMSMDNLASAYNAAERHADAAALGEETLAAQRVKFGSEHTVTLKCMNNLAGVYYSLGRYAEAAKLREEILALRRVKLGTQHLDTMTSMNDLAGTYHALGRYDDAAMLHEEALALRKAKLGADHPATLSSMHNLAGCYASLQRYDEAMAMLEDTLTLQKAKLGAEHPATLSTMNNLAGCYHGLERYDEAVKLFEEMLTIRKLTPGTARADMLMNMYNLAGCYSALDRDADAAALLEDTLAETKEALGPEHPQTLMCINGLAVSYEALGRTEEAIELYEDCLALQKVNPGPEHPQTLSSMKDLASSYLKVGRYAEAIKLREELLDLRKSKFGPEHPETLEAMHELAHAFRKANRELEALPLFAASREARKKNLGAAHADTVHWTGCLMASYVAVGRARDALPLLEETLAVQREELGPAHPVTLDSTNALARMMATSPIDGLRDGRRAITLATEGCELTDYKVPALVDTLAAAYAEVGDFESAIKWSESAIKLLDDNGDAEQREQFSQALANYKSNKPTRQQEGAAEPPVEGSSGATD